ncbi:hypothetical protein BO70DRAFT_187552 [Aspergillus heteromorphus CBS 117.55]|uniref:Uncharacterized protein n=1 Tax=Aspergillus heteromorphus CBS 117.55 TaxID=1448321 RepID=A0A317UXT7_9EURO|nr:uncharacterized protein BO70DRAFT_187552 [Aspergillus heteromorphus CBS 117.55]PWY65327.1 hypothetical protein BO70DRAFT_187552 [Aspergillus heteromorphus CBS 117.55]
MRRVSILQAELDSTQALVQVTCAERDDLRNLLEKKQAEFRAEDQEAAEEMKKLLAELTAQENTDDPEAVQKSAVELTRQVAAQIEKNLERLAKRAEYIHQQNEHIKFLQERIRQAEEDTDEGISKERELELQKVIDAQARELALMSSSWYELQSRLQNNNISMSRYRHGSLADAQKGWLARQRNVVAGR